MVKMSDLFGFVNDLENIKYGLGFKLILKRINNDRALFRVGAGVSTVAKNGIIEIRDISWCVPRIDPNNDNRIIVQKGLNKTNDIDFSYYEEKKCYKNVHNDTNFLFDLIMESGMERLQYDIIGFENNNAKEQIHDASMIDIMNFIECYCTIDKEFYPEDRMNINYGTNNYNEAFKEIVNFIKDYNGLPHNIKPYTIIEHSKVVIEYLYLILDIKYKYDHIGPQPIQLVSLYSLEIVL